MAGTFSVVATLVRESRDDVTFIYKLRQAGETWKIVDIHVDGVSQLALTRSQYSSLYRREGFEGLMTGLNREIAEQRAPGDP